MTEWALVEPASPEKPGKVRRVKTTVLKPGMAFVYNEGDLHSPSRSGPTRLIRIEGRKNQVVSLAAGVVLTKDQGLSGNPLKGLGELAGGHCFRGFPRRQRAGTRPASHRACSRARWTRGSIAATRGASRAG